jgi:hypothetical protein
MGVMGSMGHVDIDNTHFLEEVSAAHFAVANTKERGAVSSETAPHRTDGCEFRWLAFLDRPGGLRVAGSCHV